MHTFVLSDMHLSDAEPVDPKRPMWRSFRGKKHFVDADMIALARHAAALAEAEGDTAELVLNGDVFDFDPVVKMPVPPPPAIHWLARLRGLGTEQWMSAFKMQCILADHPELFVALGDFVRRGHHLVFVMGNHDLELVWPAVQDLIRNALRVEPADHERIRFCEWFYLSVGDVFVSHGHHYDPYCVPTDGINPLIAVRGVPRVRLPFGDVANRYMLNGMGYFNPHATANYIMTGRQYVKFFFKYMVRDQPLLLWTWLWSAAVTLLITLAEFFRPALRDPMTIEDKVQGIADRSRATPAMVRQLAAVDVPSACTNPLMIVRELWLDRAILFVGMVYLAWQVILWVNLAWPISPWWVMLPFSMLFPLYMQYSFQVKPETFAQPLLTPERAEWIARITGVRFAVMGHTHLPEMAEIGPLQFCNAGFWSPAFSEPECKNRIGTQTYAWLRPQAGGDRTMDLMEWPPGAQAPVVAAVSLSAQDQASVTTAVV